MSESDHSLHDFNLDGNFEGNILGSLSAGHVEVAPVFSVFVFKIKYPGALPFTNMGFLSQKRKSAPEDGKIEATSHVSTEFTQAQEAGEQQAAGTEHWPPVLRGPFTKLLSSGQRAFGSPLPMQVPWIQISYLHLP